MGVRMLADKIEPRKRMARKRLDENSETKRLQLIIPQSIIDRIDVWRGLQKPPLNASAAVRKLCEIALELEDKRNGRG